MIFDCFGWPAAFDRRPMIYTAAHGRVNLIGEHTDYNDGFVLPTPIPQHAKAWLTKRPGDRVRAASAQFAADGISEYRLGDERLGERRRWIDYVMGVTAVLRGAGYNVTGFDLFVDSDVPVGGGLSSSAALEVAVLRALRGAFDLKLDNVAIAKLGQRVENEFVGARVGLMDQMSASVGRPGNALFFDVREMRTELVPLPDEAEWVVIDSGVAHDHAAGDYNTRRGECEAACAALGIGSLRELTVADLPKLAALPEPLGRRARHVVTENQRVLDALAVLRADDLPAFGKLMSASHASQRDDYKVSIPAIDALVDIAEADPAVLGARLTGGGFGGSIVALTTERKGLEIGKRVLEKYRVRTGNKGTLLTPD